MVLFSISAGATGATGRGALLVCGGNGADYVLGPLAQLIVLQGLYKIHTAEVFLYFLCLFFVQNERAIMFRNEQLIEDHYEH